MQWYDWLLFIDAILLVVVIMFQRSKDDIRDAFSGGKTDQLKNQKSRGIELVMQRATSILAVVFFVLVSLAIILR